MPYVGHLSRGQRVIRDAAFPWRLMRTWRKPGSSIRANCYRYMRQLHDFMYEIYVMFFGLVLLSVLHR